MPETGRMYRCLRCGDLVVVCRSCEHGQIYCFAGCAGIARRERQREAGRRYQSSLRGRFAHAARSRRYRQRQRARTQIVTHQGSVALQANDLLRIEATVTVTASIDAATDVVAHEVVPAAIPDTSSSCKRCGAHCAGGVRLGFLRRHRCQPNSALTDLAIARALHPFLHDHSP